MKKLLINGAGCLIIFCVPASSLLYWEHQCPGVLRFLLGGVGYVAAAFVITILMALGFHLMKWGE